MSRRRSLGVMIDTCLGICVQTCKHTAGPSVDTIVEILAPSSSDKSFTLLDKRTFDIDRAINPKSDKFEKKCCEPGHLFRKKAHSNPDHMQIRSRLTNRRSSGMDQHDTIHEEDENVSESSSNDSESSCDSSSSLNRSSSSSSSIGEDRDADSDSVASAPSQIGESNTPRPPKHLHPHTHHHHYHQHSKTASVRGCDFLRAQGGKCLVRLKYHRTGGLTVVHPEDSLYSALRLLAHCKLHRLPVFDDPMSGSGNPLFILTHRSLLAYLYKKQIDLPRPKYLQNNIRLDKYKIGLKDKIVRHKIVNKENECLENK
ncbi:hypothetical protein ACTXT7_005651 [Hymenolepis weldensis]